MTKRKRISTPFNGPVESGLRSLFILAAIHPETCTLQELIYFDYLLVHSGDAGGPPSIHPPVPHRGGEWMVRRHFVQHGVAVCIARELVTKHFTTDGIKYGASHLGCSIIRYFETEYAKELALRAAWIKATMLPLGEQKLQQFFLSGIGRWGTEFTREAAVRGNYSA